jgi:hypothetical protein
VCVCVCLSVCLSLCVQENSSPCSSSSEKDALYSLCLGNTPRSLTFRNAAGCALCIHCASQIQHISDFAECCRLRAPQRGMRVSISQALQVNPPPPVRARRVQVLLTKKRRCGPKDGEGPGGDGTGFVGHGGRGAGAWHRASFDIQHLF